MKRFKLDVREDATVMWTLYDRRDPGMLRRRLAARPFWLNEQRTFWKRRPAFFNCHFWRHATDSEHQTARRAYLNFAGIFTRLRVKAREVG